MQKKLLINNSLRRKLTVIVVLAFINILSERLLEYKKPLDFSKVPGVSNECRRDFMYFLAALKKFDLWALRSKFQQRLEILLRHFIC